MFLCVSVCSPIYWRNAQCSSAQLSAEPEWMIHIHQADNKNIILYMCIFGTHTVIVVALWRRWWVEECDLIGIKKKRKERKREAHVHQRAELLKMSGSESGRPREKSKHEMKWSVAKWRENIFPFTSFAPCWVCNPKLGWICECVCAECAQVWTYHARSTI